MPRARNADLIADLRACIRRIENPDGERPTGVLPFGVSALDRHLPRGGLALGALHEVEGGGSDAAHAAAAALFAAGILARTRGPVLWCLTARDLFAPALAGVGLHPDRVIYAEAGAETGVLFLMEEGLRHRGLAGVVAETSGLGLTASRRLQLAAEGSGVTAFLLRRWRDGPARMDRAASAATTRWRITALPSAPLPAPGVGPARWRVDLVRCRGSEPASFVLEACDAQGRLALPADLADGPAPAEARRASA